MQQSLTALAVVLVTAFPFHAAPTSKPKKVEDALQGDWVAVELEEKGSNLSAEEVAGEHITAVFSKDKLEFRHSPDYKVRAAGHFILKARTDKLFDLDLRLAD